MTSPISTKERGLTAFVRRVLRQLTCRHQYDPVMIGGGEYTINGERYIVGIRTFYACPLCGKVTSFRPAGRRALSEYGGTDG